MLNRLESPHGTGLRALGDRHIAAAIELIHGRPEYGWTVGELASKVALSRSAFAARFRELVGESPLQYITRTRLAHAAELLRTTDASLAQIAARAGHGTEFSFSKAFKRAFGVAHGAYRSAPAASMADRCASAGLVDHPQLRSHSPMRCTAALTVMVRFHALDALATVGRCPDTLPT